MYFRITVVDEATGRGVPLARVSTVNGLVFYTDSAGVVAFHEPGMMDCHVYFTVESPGYTIVPDEHGAPGRSAETTPGHGVTIPLRRTNIAQRLYRITGGGIYRDSVLLGDTPPIRKPVVNAHIVGQDTVLTAVYRGKLLWAWGDTWNPGHPATHNYKVTCALSELPANGGLDPETGIDLHYFTSDGFARPMAAFDAPYLYWLTGLAAVKDGAGRERLVAGLSEIEPPLTERQRFIVEFDDKAEVFRKVAPHAPGDRALVGGHAFPVRAGGRDYIYFADSSRLTRVRALYEDFAARNVEAWTCLQQGSAFDPDNPAIDRTPDGRVLFSWKPATAPTGHQELHELVQRMKIAPSERTTQFSDPETGKPIVPHAGSIRWNAFRRRWVMIFCERFGTSPLGETWYSEADCPEGPWVFARKVATHPGYSFYNPLHHDEFDKEEGRIVFFEGTYTKEFSGAPAQTPRYDYNQIMYKLELDDARLMVPIPVYRTHGEQARYAMLADLRDDEDAEIAFYAFDRPRKGTIPVYQSREGRLFAGLINHAKAVLPCFYAVPTDDTRHKAATQPLIELPGSDPDTYEYRVGPTEKGARPPQRICRVWRNPVGCAARIPHSSATPRD